MWVGAGVLALGAAVAAVLPFSTRASMKANAAAETAQIGGDGSGSQPALENAEPVGAAA